MKIIRDVVHGYIEIDDSDLKIIDTPIFQRLKWIKHLNAHTVYPSTQHTRFEHSLGVMYLGTQVLTSLMLEKKIDKKFFEKYKNTVKYACLLHDIGHAPFSHVCEEFYDVKECKRILDHFKINITKGANHELMSCAIVLEELKGELDELKVNTELLCRMITGAEYADPSKWKLNVLIKILNSIYDVDKLDYLVRDSVMTGTRITTLDVARIIRSYTIHKNELVFSSKVLSVISNLVYGRDALYMWVYNHHGVAYTCSLIRRYVGYLLSKKLISRKKFFSFKAISKELIDDSDIIKVLKQYKNKDKRTKRLHEQIFYRKHLKPLWKTPFDFEKIIRDSKMRDDIVVKAKAATERFEEDIRQRLRLNQDDLYVVVATFKPFSPEDSGNLYIAIQGENRRFTDIFKESILQQPYKELPYIFTRPELKEKVIAYLNNPDARL